MQPIFELDSFSLRLPSDPKDSEELLGAVYQISAEKGALRVKTRTLGDITVEIFDEDQFRVVKPGVIPLTLEFTRGPDKQVSGFSLSAGPIKGVEFVKTSK